jgi:hypothetical protein
MNKFTYEYFDLKDIMIFHGASNPQLLVSTFMFHHVFCRAIVFFLLFFVVEGSMGQAVSTVFKPANPDMPAGLAVPLSWVRAPGSGGVDTLWTDLSGHGYPARLCTAVGDFASRAGSTALSSSAGQLHDISNDMSQTKLPSLPIGGQDSHPAGHVSTFSEHAGINFNPAIFLCGGDFLAIDSPLLRGNSLTCMIVYQVSSGLGEQGLWSWSTGDAKGAGLSTLRTFRDGHAFAYTDSNRLYAVINTLKTGFGGIHSSRFSMPSRGRLCLGMASDTLMLEGYLSECLLFEQHPADSLLLPWQSCLALKYGVTLFKTNYTSSEGVVFWDHDAYPGYSYAIGGIGRDDAAGVYQRQTYLDRERVVVGIGNRAVSNAGNGATFGSGNFLMWGMDTALSCSPSSYIDEQGVAYVTHGNGLLQATGEEARLLPSFLHVSAAGWQGNIGEYELWIDKSGTGDFGAGMTIVHAPDSVDTVKQVLYFNNITWDIDHNGVDRFCFSAIDKSLSPDSERQGKSTRSAATGNSTSNGENEVFIDGNRYRLYPNPNDGHYRVEVDFWQDAVARVLVHDPSGKLLHVHEGGKSSNHVFSGHVQVKGAYLVEITGNGSRYIFKMIVN